MSVMSVVSPYFDGLSVSAAPHRGPPSTNIAGTNDRRPNSTRAGISGRYVKLTRQQLTNTIQKSDVGTLNGFNESIHGTGICLNARHTLTMEENAGPTYRWRYHGDIQKIATDEHILSSSIMISGNGCQHVA